MTVDLQASAGLKYNSWVFALLRTSCEQALDLRVPGFLSPELRRPAVPDIKSRLSSQGALAWHAHGSFGASASARQRWRERFRLGVDVTLKPKFEPLMLMSYHFGTPQALPQEVLQPLALAFQQNLKLSGFKSSKDAVNPSCLSSNLEPFKLDSRS